MDAKAMLHLLPSCCFHPSRHPRNPNLLPIDPNLRRTLPTLLRATASPTPDAGEPKAPEAPTAAESLPRPPRPTTTTTLNIKYRARSRRQAKQQQQQQLAAREAAPPPRKEWEEMTLAEKAAELYVGEKGLLFWLNKFAYASIFAVIGGWILFRFVGPSLGLYQLDSPPLAPTSIFKG